MSTSWVRTFLENVGVRLVVESYPMKNASTRQLKMESSYNVL